MFISQQERTFISWCIQRWQNFCKTTKGRVVPRGDNAKDDTGGYLVFAEHGSSASHMTAAKVLGIAVSVQPAQNEWLCQTVKISIDGKLDILDNCDDTVVHLELNLNCHPLAGVLWERQLVDSFSSRMEISSMLGVSLLSRSSTPFCLCMSTVLKWLDEKNVWHPWRKMDGKRSTWKIPCRCLGQFHVVVTQREATGHCDFIRAKSNLFAKVISAETDVLPDKNAHEKQWVCCLELRHEKVTLNIVERCCGLAKHTIAQLQRMATPCLDDIQFAKDDFGIVGAFGKVCVQFVSTCVKFARIWRPDLLWTANVPARAATKWKRAKRLALLISNIHVQKMQTILACSR